MPKTSELRSRAPQWTRRLRAHQKRRHRSNNQNYWFRYEIGSDCVVYGKKVGWTAAGGAGAWWWRTPNGGTSAFFDCEADAKANFEYQILGIVPKTQHQIHKGS